MFEYLATIGHQADWLPLIASVEHLDGVAGTATRPTSPSRSTPARWAMAAPIIRKQLTTGLDNLKAELDAA